METLLDIKNALKDVPDELLGSLWFGCGEGCEETVSILALEGDEKYGFPQVFDLIDKKYPEINKLNKLIQNIASAQSIINSSEKSIPDEDRIYEEGITDTFFDKKEVKASQSKSVNVKEK